MTRRKFQTCDFGGARNLAQRLVPILVGYCVQGGLAQEAVPAELTKRYQATADRIVAEVMKGNQSYEKLTELCDDIGHRLSGSTGMARAVDWALETLRRDGHENVRAEPVMVPHWVRGAESAVMLEPREMPLCMLGLGGSVATPPEGVTAEVVTVSNREELEALGEGVRGKIVLFNHAMPPYTPERGTSYGTTVQYRSNGASWAARHGAVAALVRSVTARSLQTPHTGGMRYAEDAPKIPTAAVSIEDAELISRLYKRGVRVVVRLKMESHFKPDAPSANVVAELRGRELPDEIVVISGHLDSWDVGQGAHDDGAGCVMAMEALRVLRKLDLRPRRTIRVVLFTNEENGLAGGRQYAKDHERDLANHVAAIESDSGGFAPVGYGVSLKDESRQPRAVEQLRQITALLGAIGATRATSDGGGADIGPMKPFGVPLLSHDVDVSTYFDIHHTHADTLDKVDPVDLSRNVAAMAVVSYVLADMPGRLGDP